MLTAELTESLTDLVLPRRCVGCGRPGHPLCALCTGVDPALERRGELVVASAGPYGGGLRAAVLAYKERGRRDLARRLAGLLATALAHLGVPGGAVLVPVPSARAVAAARGGDHVARLARGAAPAVGARVARGALSLTADVRDSAGLGIAARAANLHHAMRAHAPPVGAPAAIVVDDVVTTGATLREAARALTAAGWVVAGAAAVARTPLHNAQRGLG